MRTACIKIGVPGYLTLVALHLFISTAFGDLPDAEKYVSIEQHMSNRFITGSIKGIGGFQQNCIEFNLRNMRSDTLFVKIEPGRRLVSEDTMLQDIFIVKENKFTLLPFEKKKVNGFGFCCESHMRGPYRNANFSIGFMAPPQWVRLADTINNNTFDPSEIQHAVWVFSNNHPLSSIHGKDNSLRKMAAAIKGVEEPWYSTTYEEDTAMLFSGRAYLLTGTVPFYVKTSSMVSIVVRNIKSGKLMAVPLKKSAHNPGAYTYNLIVSVKNWPKGEYEVLIYEDEYNLNLRKNFSL